MVGEGAPLQEPFDPEVRRKPVQLGSRKKKSEKPRPIAGEAFFGHVQQSEETAQIIADLEPKAPVAWIYLSACEEKVGHKQAAVEAAKRATTVSPAYLPAWLSLVRAEKFPATHWDASAP